MKKFVETTRQMRSITTKNILRAIIFVAVLVSFFGLISQSKVAAAFFPTATTKTIRVIEIRYFPLGRDSAHVIYQPDVLSQQLRDGLRDGSKFHLYKNPYAAPAVNVQIVGVYNRDSARPNRDGYWETTYNDILAQDNICSRINNENIDQIWLWVDPRAGYDPNPGVEYAISSKYFSKNLDYVTYPSTPFCGGGHGFVFMGFDTTRPVDNALHSFGHMMEGMLGNLQTVELFWFRFAGNTQNGWPLERSCGNVHYAPNSVIDYDIASMRTVSSTCENWNPDVNGAAVNLNCTKWGCTEAGHMKWWFQNMPNMSNSLLYQGRKLPNWFDFLSNYDATVKNYASNSAYFMNSNFLTSNNIPIGPASTPVVTPSPTATPVSTQTPSPTATTLPHTTPTSTPNITTTATPSVSISVSVSPTVSSTQIVPSITQVVVETSVPPQNVTTIPSVPTTELQQDRIAEAAKFLLLPVTATLLALSSFAVFNFRSEIIQFAKKHTKIPPRK